LSGIIRANDIAPDNTIPSAKIANAKIIYAGDGSIAESNTKGWFQRLVDGPYWPF
jgi:flagellar L-ring protein precursor FlgH